ncbi:MAG: hypothetical protein RMK89_04930, partial [Armatimonadota bacterium]|nr:hypothetical protein [Armatimonadota bacterium]MDW8142788.1 hypothetical protein [Armatimonadota bacterium]
QNAITWDALVDWFKTQANETIEGMRPTDKKSLTQFQRLMRPALQATLAVSVPTSERIASQQIEHKELNGLTMQQIWFGRKGVGDRIPAVQILPEAKKPKEAVLLVSEKGAAAEVWNGEGEATGLAKQLAERFEVLTVDVFRTGMASGERKTDVQFFTTYNRTDDAERVQDIVTAIAYLRQRFKRIHLIGTGTAGLWVLMAAAVTEGDGKVIVDAAQFDASSDDEFVKRLFIPCLRRVGDLRTALALVCPRPLLVHNAHPNFPRNWAESAYKAANATERLSWREQRMDAAQLVEWLIGKM